MAAQRWSSQISQCTYSMHEAPELLGRYFAVHSKKKKKRHSHHRGDQARQANLQRFSSMVFGLFDQQTSDGKLKAPHLHKQYQTHFCLYQNIMESWFNTQDNQSVLLEFEVNIFFQRIFSIG